MCWWVDFHCDQLELNPAGEHWMTVGNRQSYPTRGLKKSLYLSTNFCQSLAKSALRYWLPSTLVYPTWRLGSGSQRKPSGRVGVLTVKLFRMGSIWGNLGWTPSTCYKSWPQINCVWAILTFIVETDSSNLVHSLYLGCKIKVTRLLVVTLSLV